MSSHPYIYLDAAGRVSRAPAPRLKRPKRAGDGAAGFIVIMFGITLMFTVWGNIVGALLRNIFR